MEFNNKNVLVVGLAKSGISVIVALKQLGAHITVNDIKKEDLLYNEMVDFKPYADAFILGRHPDKLDQFDLVVMSPGVPTDLPFILELKKMSVPIIGEIELAYQLAKGKFIGITGTNGKTTTTALTGEIFEASGKHHFVVGNIGLPAVSKALETRDDTYLVTEISSFQLETIFEFRPVIAAVLNLTPDHLNRHKTMKNYIAAKARIFENQQVDDALILNYDDLKTRELGLNAKSKIYYFSRTSKVDQGAFIENGMIKTIINGKIDEICKVSNLFIFGRHNEENVLAAVLISKLAGIPIDVIQSAVTKFKGVEHRIEYVGTILNRKFYNDSKGTNPDSTVCAIESMVLPTHLIAGGMDKGSTFDSIFEVFGDKVKSLILLGETKELLKETAYKHNFTNVVLVKNMEEAVLEAFSQSKENEAILLSPACASWDMYVSYEKRGEHFKLVVKALEQERG